MASACAALLIAAHTAGAQSKRVFQSARHAYVVDTVATGLSHAWGMAFLPDGDILVTERDGRLRLIRRGQLLQQAIIGVPKVRAVGQGGLLDVAIHPQFATNRLVYLSFSKPGLFLRATTAVVRGRLDGLRLVNVEEIFVAKAWGWRTGHYGSRLAFDRNGFLFISVGERQEMREAQKLSNHQGKIIRLHDDGRVPADNPFVGRNDALPEIYTYGNRNPQGLTFHPETGELWASEHGPMGGDEINLILPGRNYGWPEVTYGINYTGQPISDLTHKEGMEQPRHFFVPSIATSGLAIYHGDAFPNWRGDAFVGGLVGMRVARVSLRDPAAPHERLLEINQRIRDVRVGPDGLLYILIDSPNAPVLRLRPAVS